MNDIAQLVPTKSDAEVAEALRMRLGAALAGIMAIMDESVAAGFVPNFQIDRQEGFGGVRHYVKLIRLEKHY